MQYQNHNALCLNSRTKIAENGTPNLRRYLKRQRKCENRKKFLRGDCRCRVSRRETTHPFGGNYPPCGRVDEIPGISLEQKEQKQY